MAHDERVPVEVHRPAEVEPRIAVGVVDLGLEVPRAAVAGVDVDGSRARPPLFELARGAHRGGVAGERHVVPQAE